MEPVAAGFRAQAGVGVGMERGSRVAVPTDSHGDACPESALPVSPVSAGVTDRPAPPGGSRGARHELPGRRETHCFSLKGRRSQKRTDVLLALTVLLFMCVWSALHGALRASARRSFQRWASENGALSGLDDFGVLLRTRGGPGRGTGLNHTCAAASASSDRSRTRRVADPSLAGAPVRAVYRARALADLGLDVGVVDLGQHAGQTTGACFWLCLAAGLASAGWQPAVVSGQALPAVVGPLLAEVRAMDLHALDALTGAAVGDTALGTLAAVLRAHFCGGDSAVLLRLDMKERIYQAFTGVLADGPARTLKRYKTWVKKLADWEFADELVVVAVAIELKIRVVCVPFTPPSAAGLWAISTYLDSQGGVPADRTVHVGNNDVHYMFLHRSAA